MKNAAILHDRTLDFLNGRVKKVIRKTYKLEGNSKSFKDQYFKEYTPEGVRMKTIYYKNDGSIKQEQISNFDSHGLKIGYTNYDNNKVIDSEGNYDIDGKGNILRKYFRGNLEEIYRYDTKGRMIEQISAFSKDKVEYHYGNTGNFAIESIYYIQGEKTYFTKYENDLHGNIVRAETYRLPSMELAHTQIYIINSKGDVIEEYAIRGNGDKINWVKSDYEYDSFGNWISRILTYVASNSKEIDERVIDYFD